MYGTMTWNLKGYFLGKDYNIMKTPKSYLNNYIKEELLAAFDSQDVCVSYSGDYQKGTLTQVHNSCELLFVEEGGADYQINDKVYSVMPNTVLIIGATDRHHFHFTKVPYVRYGLTLIPSFLSSLPIDNGYISIFQTQSPEQHCKLSGIDSAVFQRMIKILWELREETENKSGDSGNMVYALLMEMTILLKRLLQVESQENNSIYNSMNEIKAYIDLHYHEELSLSKLSKQFFLQPNTISKNFRKIWGKNINYYINSVRITNAVRILDMEDISITELSERVGYDNVNTFLRQFKEKMDVSPLQYKKKNKSLTENRDFFGSRREEKRGRNER